MSYQVGWQVLEFLWRAKGLVRKEVIDNLRKKGVKGVGDSRLTEKIRDNLEAPHAAIEVVKELKPATGCERTAEVAMVGLAALQGERPDGVTVAQLAEALRAEFPADAVAAKLAEALAKQGGPLDTLRAKLDALACSVGASVASLLAPVDRLGATLNALASYLLASLASIGGNLDALASAVGSLFATLAGIGRRLDAATGKLDAATGKLDAMADQVDRVERSLAMVAATVNDVDAKADVAAFDSERAHRRVLRSVRFVGVLALLALVAVLAVLVSLRSQWAPREQPQPTTANATQPPPFVVIVTNGMMTMSSADALVRALATVLDMGKKEKEKEYWIPKDPYPWQKLAKDCDPDLSEEPINGGCWVKTFHELPCGKLFRYGDKCYRPVAADPTKPVGGPTPGPVREGPWMAPGTTNDGRGRAG